MRAYEFGGIEMVVELVKLGEDNLCEIKKLNAVIFPVHDQDKDYVPALASAGFSKLAYCDGSCVGSMACRIERSLGGKRLFIMSLGILAPYRRQGIGTKLMTNLLDFCARDSEIMEIYLHVQTSNEEALAFYKKFGFEVVKILRNYYKRLDPPDCYLLTKNTRQE